MLPLPFSQRLTKVTGCFYQIPSPDMFLTYIAGLTILKTTLILVLETRRARSEPFTSEKLGSPKVTDSSLAKEIPARVF